ncbi:MULTISPECIES: propionyl-CoA synthetase [Pseudovibrio]|uniref:propionyl-CoA synthetase n=1 Tax=Stappiaceae TaxID=2821832 RepID=UPI00236628F0|nr:MULTISPECIES: propionyl-CoA synthetase [Pseudovibrio]MDD7911886.1 propionyl-CoA synthetase [Pseudovibrio exalbescens]MDX5595448.1 propionyl-CoA synthetase [Pseudovibrio sp. SPO723]
MASRYAEVYGAWQSDPVGFWEKAAGSIDWMKPWDKAFDETAGAYGRWFVGAECNTCYNCLDRHVSRGRPGQPALIYDSPVTNTKKKYSYKKLLDHVIAMAAVMKDHGVEKGDRVLIYMPMIPEAVMAMLACARLGAVHSVVFGGFAAHELATRINDAKPKLVVSASCGIEPGRVVPYKPLLDDAIDQATHKPEACLIQQREQATAALKIGRDNDLGMLMQQALSAGRQVPCEPVAATDPLYVLYTSGTTGQPKGVVRDNGGHMVALKWTMENLYGVEPGEVFWAASDVGWVVGHSYIVYGPLLHGATTVLYEGKPVGTPDAGAFWRVISEYQVSSLFTAPTAFRAIKKEDPSAQHLQRYDVTGLRSLFLAGERADPDTIIWAEDILRVPVIDHWWQTETGWCIAGNPLGLGPLPVKRGSSTVPMPGYHIDVVDEGGQPQEAGMLGNIVVKLPLPPGCLPTLWDAEERFVDSYLSEFKGYYKTSDAGLLDEDGYLFIMSRTDDIINVAGHRLSTGAMEEALAGHQDVAECAVIGVADELKGQLPCGFVVLKDGVDRTPETIEKELIALVREQIGPVAAFKKVLVIDRLPKTRSGKILRGTMRSIADGQEYKMPATIDDPMILEEIASALNEKGFVKSS